MGNKQSKPTTFELKNTQDLPIHFNPSFIERLSTLDKPEILVEESQVQQRVEEELQRYEQKRLLNEKRSVQMVDREAQDLLDRQHPLPPLKISPEMERLQQNVILCYRSKPLKVLDCQKEILEFKKAEKELLQSFIASQ
jgi:hypothetical protein